MLSVRLFWNWCLGEVKVVMFELGLMILVCVVVRLVLGSLVVCWIGMFLLLVCWLVCVVWSVGLVW